MSDGFATDGARYRTRSTTYAVALDGEVLIWDSAGVRLHRLNPSASRVWSELSVWRSPAEVAAALSGVVVADSARLSDDVASCIEELARAGLVDRRAPSSE
jgi:hypothetical protein